MLKQDRILKKYQLLKPFEVCLPTRQDWNTPNKITNPDVDLCFTDMLGINDCFDVGIYRPMYKHRESILMGSLSTVFSDEVMDILRCAELPLIKNMTMRRTHICSDSRAALAALAKTTTELTLVLEFMQILGKLSEFSKVTLVWIPGHQGIPEDDEADGLSKEEAIGVPLGQLSPLA